MLLKHLKRVRHAGELGDLTLPGEERRGHKQTQCVRRRLRGAEEGLGEWTGREGGRAEEQPWRASSVHREMSGRASEGGNESSLTSWAGRSQWDEGR